MKQMKAFMVSVFLIGSTVLFTLAVTGTALADCPDNIAAYWKLDDTNYEDFIGGNDAFTGKGDPDPAPDELINGAQRFVAANTDGLDTNPSSVFNWTGTESFSIELWVQTDGDVTPGGQQVMVGRADSGETFQWYIGVNSSGNANFFFFDGSETSSGAGADVSDGNPHHLVLVRNGATGDNSFYVDDNAPVVDNQAFSQGFASDSAALTIGYLNQGTFFYFDGFIDEVAIYSRVLTPAEITAHRTAAMDYCGSSEAASAFAPYPDNTTALWHLDEASGSDYVDIIGGNNAFTGKGDPDPAPDELINGAQKFVAANTDGLDTNPSSAFNWTGTESFSIELWVQTDGDVTPGGQQVMVGRTDSVETVQWYIGVNSSGNANFYFNDGSGTSSGAGADVSDGNPHHLVFVRNGTTGDNSFYVDDNAPVVDNQAFSQGFASDSAALTIGYLNQGTFFYFDGFIDEVAIYSRVLTPAEITTHRTAGQDGSSVDTLRPAPTANATTDTPNVIEGDTVTLDGSGSSTYAAEITSYQWTQTDATGITVSLSDATVPKPTFTAPAVTASTTLTFSLTVTASDGQTSSTPATVNVVVADSTAPTANAGPAQSVTEDDTVTLDGSGSMPAVTGATLTYAWTQTDATGLTATLSDATAAKPTFTAPAVDAAGAVLTFQLVVTENGIPSAPATVSITVNDATTSPDADAGPDQAVTEGATVTLDGSGSLPATVGGTLTYSWTQTDTTGFTVTLSDAAVVSPTFTAPDVTSAGATLTFQLMVTEGTVTSTDSVNIVVNDAVNTGGGGGGGCFIGSMF